MITQPRAFFGAAVDKTLSPGRVAEQIAAAFGIPLQINFVSPAEGEGHCSDIKLTANCREIVQLVVTYDIFVGSGPVDTIVKRFKIVEVD